MARMSPSAAISVTRLQAGAGALAYQPSRSIPACPLEFSLRALICVVAAEPHRVLVLVLPRTSDGHRLSAATSQQLRHQQLRRRRQQSRRQLGQRHSSVWGLQPRPHFADDDTRSTDDVFASFARAGFAYAEDDARSTDAAFTTCV